jgi:hypothetical protein
MKQTPALLLNRRLIALLTRRYDPQQFYRQRPLQGGRIIDGATKPSGGKPQRIIVNSRSPSGAARTTGAIVSGNTAGRPGRLPVDAK